MVDLQPKVGTLSTAFFADMMDEVSCPFSGKAPIETDLSLRKMSPSKLIAGNVLMIFV
jgi:hypothetical protein